MKTQDDRIHHFDESFRFIVAMARASIRYGGYTFETDMRLSRVISALGLKGEINATPNYIQIAVWLGEEDRQNMYMAITRDTAYNLAKLAQLETLGDQIISGKVSPAEGLDHLKEIERSPAIFGNPINALAFVLCGAGFAVIIGLPWLNVVLGGIFGLVSFGITRFAARSFRVAIIMELLAAAIVAFVASILAVFQPGIIPAAVTVCAIVWFIPGFSLTIAPREIIFHNTLSGIIYLTNALVVFVKLFAGGLIGLALARYFIPVPVPESLAGVNPVWAWVFVPMLVIGLAILFNVVPRELKFVVVAALLVWAGVQVGNPFGYWQGTFFGAVILTVFAGFSAARFRIPSATILLPVIMILVPGYAFLRALYLAEAIGLAEGLYAGFQVIIIIGAIIAGVFVGDAIGSFNVVERIDVVKKIKR